MKKFIRLKKGRKIFGICEGLGLITITDPILWRVLFITLIFSPFPIILFYILTALITDEI
jgi:phage shock protein PspC (stress-responsive transcriptional regulator)